MALLATKLYFPVSRPNSVARPQLVEKLDSGLRGPFTLISAPAGSGKTSLMAEWRAGPGCGAQAAWLSLDSADNDLHRFLTYLTAALESVATRLTQSVTFLLQQPQTPPIEMLVNTLHEALSNIAADLVLVLDDYHLITNLQIHDLINQLLSHPNPLFHLAILTRADPPLSLGRLRVRNELTEIRAADLRFTQVEARSFLSQTMGLSLAPELAVALEERTEGWIAGLQLAALSLQGREDAADFAATFSGSHHYVVDYLADEVLSLQTETMRDFLLKTSILERMSGSLCNALTGRSDGQAILEDMHRTNLFVSPLDDDRNWYRYHHLFGEVLQNRLRQANASSIPDLHHRAAGWYEQNGFLSEAVAHELASQDLERAAQLVDRNTATMLMRGEMRTLLQWMEAIDPVLHQHASLCITKAWALAFTNRSDVVEDLLQETESLIAGDGANPLWGDLAALRSYLAGVRGQSQNAIAYGREALERLPESNIIVRGVVHLSMGGAYWIAGDFAGTEDAFEQAARIGMKVGSAHLASTALCGLANRCAALGELRRAREFNERAVQVSTGKDGRLLPTAADACINLGNLLYEWNDFKAAEQYLNDGIRLIRLLGRVSTLADGLVSLARLREAQGDSAQAAELLREAESHQQRSILHPAVSAHLVVERIGRALRMGDIEFARRMVKQACYTVDQPVTYPNAAEMVLFGQYLLAGREPAQAVTLARNLVESAAAHGWIDVLIRSLVLHALALFEQGRTTQAEQPMGQAVQFAREEGYVRSFLDQGEGVRKILGSLKPEDGPTKAYVFKLLAAFAEASSPVRQTLAEPLSDRELEVLRLVALGRSNQQIAEELVLATGTVKKHLYNIFEKLDVQNRTECVARAKEFNLL